MEEPSPRWLSAEEQQVWRSLVGTLVHLPAALDAQLRRDAGLTHFEYLVLAGLSEAPGRTLRMSALAGFAEGSPSRLSQVVDRLERRGWVERAPDPSDRRATLGRLTDAGWQKVVATAPGHVAEVRRLVLDALTPAQVTQLGRITARIEAAVGPAACRPG